MYAAGRHRELLALIDRAPFKWWHNRRWGVKALAAMGKKAEAIRYAEDSRGLNDPGWQIAEACEAVLLSSGLAEEAYRRYAIAANQGTTNLATFRAITKKYPHVPPEQVLQDLIAGTPGAEGKWFAAAKEAGMFELQERVHRRCGVRVTGRQTIRNQVCSGTRRCRAERGRGRFHRAITVNTPLGSCRQVIKESI